MEGRWCFAGGDKGALEDRDRQGAPQPRAASRFAAAFPFAKGVSAFVWDEVREIYKSIFGSTLARREWIRAMIRLLATGLIARGLTQ